MAARARTPLSSLATPQMAARARTPLSSLATPQMAAKARTPLNSLATPPTAARAHTPLNSLATPPMAAKARTPLNSLAIPPTAARARTSRCAELFGSEEEKDVEPSLRILFFICLAKSPYHSQMRSVLVAILLLPMIANCHKTGAAEGTSSSAHVDAAVPLRIQDLGAQGSPLEGKFVRYDLLEPLPRAVSIAGTPLAPEIRAPELIGINLTLVARSFVESDPNRYSAPISVTLQRYMHVYGVLQRDRTIEKQSGLVSYVLLVDRAETMPVEPPVVTTIAEIAKAPAQWDRKRVTVEGKYTQQFEASFLDSAWLAFDTDMAASSRIVGSRSKLKVEGIVYAAPGHRYGHMGASAFQITAFKIDVLEP